jgi:hypothetical protein
MEFQLTTRPAWVLLEFSGGGHVEEVKSAYMKGVEVCRETSLPSILLDTRRSHVHPSFDGVRELADFVRSFNPDPPPRTALVVGSDLQYGLARMLGALVGLMHWEFRIFRDIESAEAWLGGS